MTQVIQQVNLNLIPQIFGANSVLVPCSQYDKSYRVIQFNVYNGRELYSIPSTCTVLIRGTKKDLTGFEYNCEFSGSQVIFPLEPQITVLSGKVPAELRIVNGEELIGSANFLFMVEPSPLTDDTIISETQLPLLEEALQAAAEAEQSRILAEAAKESAQDSAQSASESEANALTYSQNAQASANSASQSATNALTSEQNAKESEDLAQGYSQDAQGYASNASDSATSASQSAQHAEDVVQDIEDYVAEAQGYAEQSLTNAQNASVSAQNALTSENNAHTSEVNARASEQSASQSETNASQSATSASQSATSASQSATNSANSATQSAQSATQASQSATSAQTSATSAEESATEAQTILDNIDSLIANKADQDGIYPNMSVGSAEKLLTSETVDDEFTYQSIKHDGYARINSVRGNTVVWNQQIDSYGYNRSNITQNADGTYTATCNTETTYYFGFSMRDESTIFKPTVDHKYFFSTTVTSANFTNFDHYTLGNGVNARFPINQTTGTFEAVMNARSNSTTYFSAATVGASTVFTTEESFTAKNFIIIDLTQMFGSTLADQIYAMEQSSSGSGVAWLKSLFPLSYYNYDTGSLLSFNGEGIKVTDTDGNESTLSLPISTYFPNGMKSAGSVYDELTEKKAITRIGAVDLGTLVWTYNSTYNMFYATVQDMSTSTTKGGICVPYENVNVWISDPIWTNGDKIMTLYASDKLVRIKDSSYATASDFKTAMNGVMLYYELATYEETDIDLDLTYTVESGGTEQLLPINGSVPVTSPMSRNASFFYDSNVVANLLTLLSSVAQVETSPTTHAYSVGDYLIYNYQLYRVTSAIAVGGTLTVGTNIVATTLVAIINS